MDFNDKITVEPFTVLETPISSTKSRLIFQSLMNHLGIPLFTWYNNVKGTIMTIVNGKLVKLDIINSEKVEDTLEAVYQPVESQNRELEYLQLSVNSLDSRVNNLETSTLQQLQQKLVEIEKQTSRKIVDIEKQTSRKILAITVVGAIGFTSLGLWIGLSNNSSASIKNPVNYSESNEF